MNDSTDLHIQGLEMKGGLEAGIKYPANYIHAPMSLHPPKQPHDMSIPHGKIMKITLGC